MTRSAATKLAKEEDSGVLGRRRSEEGHQKGDFWAYITPLKWESRSGENPNMGQKWLGGKRDQKKQELTKKKTT